MIQAQVLNYILQNKDSSIIKMNNLTEEYFSDYKNEFNYIKNHINTYKVVCDLTTFLNIFPNFDIFEVKEPVSYLIKTLYDDYNTRTLAKTFNNIRNLLMSNETDKAIEIFKKSQESLVQGVSLQSVDILKDTSRYNDYLEKCDNFDKFYISTGFKELDAIIGGFDRQEELATIVARTNYGKCLAKGTEVLMADGTLKKVEDIKVGDKVQSLNRVNTVLALHNGKSRGYRIIPKLGDSFIISENHILTVMVRNNVLRKGNILHTTDNTFTLRDLSIEEYLQSSKSYQKRCLLYRPAVFYETKEQFVPPYILGLWLGDGTSCRISLTNIDKEIIKEWCDWGYKYTPNIRISSNTYDITNASNHATTQPLLDFFKKNKLFNNKHIPLHYLTGDTNQRLELLAGLLDTDGYYSKRGNNFSLCLKSELLIKQVAQLARGLGLRVSKIYTRTLNNKVKGLTNYYTINIYGQLDIIPTRLPRKQATIISRRKLSLTNFTVEEIPEVEYFGFMADGDSRYLLADNTLTHNTWILLKCALASAKQGLNVGIYSGEMSERKVGYRIDTLLGNIPNGQLIHGNSNIQEEYKNYIDSLPTKINGSLKVLTPKMIEGPADVNALEMFIDKENLDILFVDQLSLLEDRNKAKNPVERASNISKDLKNLQVMKRIPIISVSQQNRTTSENGSVNTTQIAMSDRIGQDSTLILFLEKKDEIIKLTIVKSRDSENGKVLTYVTDLNRGIFTYVPDENDSNEQEVKDLEHRYEIEETGDNVF